MAVSLQARRTEGGEKYFTATVRVRPFSSTSKTFRDRTLAVEWARSCEKELKRQAELRAVRLDVSRVTVAQLVTEYLGAPETQALTSRERIADYLAWWTNRCGTDRVMEFGVAQIRAARDAFRKERQHGPGTASTNRSLGVMRACWNWGRDAGLVPPERAWPHRLMLTESKGRVRYLDDLELARVLKAAATHSTVMHAAILVSLGCGIRRGELQRLKWTDVDLERRQLRIVKAKNTKADGETRSRGVYIPAVTLAALQELRRASVIGQHVICDERGNAVDRGWLFRRWDEIRDAAKLEDFRWHDLRHCCASFLAQNGASLLEIGSVLGHKNPATTMRYAHLVDAKPVTGHAGLDAKLQGAK